MNLDNRNHQIKNPENLSLDNKEDFIPTNKLFRWFLVGLLFALALGFRIYRINDPSLEFYAVRQYHSALLSRYYYFLAEPSFPDWQRQIAAAQKPENLEPPLMEKMAALFYRMAGGVYLWFPRLLSTLFWLATAAGIYFISKKLWSETSAILSLTLFLFLPFGILASRSFQPDPLMIMFMIFAILAIILYFEKPSFERLMIAGLLAATAIFIKPVSFFMIFFAFGALMIWQKRSLRWLVQPHLWIFMLTAFVPGAFYYSYGLIISHSLKTQAGWSFIPKLWVTSFFYTGWLQNIGLVIGFGLFVVSLLALPLAKNFSRALLAGMWIGYFAFSLIFNYHTHSHHYYQLQLIPLVVLSVGYVGSLVFSRLNDFRVPWKVRAVVVVILLMAFSLDGMKQVVIRRHQIERHIDFTKIVEAAKEIGQRVNHSEKCIFLDPEYGAPLKYHGWMAGWIWYNAWEIDFRRRFRGEPELNAQELYLKKYASYQPSYFIVTDFNELHKQKDLEEFLKKRFPIIASTPRYLIFDMTRIRE